MIEQQDLISVLEPQLERTTLRLSCELWPLTSRLVAVFMAIVLDFLDTRGDFGIPKRLDCIRISQT